MQLCGQLEQPGPAVGALEAAPDRRGEISGLAAGILRGDMPGEKRLDLGACRQRRIPAQQPGKQPVAMHAGMPVKAAIENRMDLLRQGQVLWPLHHKLRQGGEGACHMAKGNACEGLGAG